MRMSWDTSGRENAVVELNLKWEVSSDHAVILGSGGFLGTADDMSGLSEEPTLTEKHFRDDIDVF